MRGPSPSLNPNTTPPWGTSRPFIALVDDDATLLPVIQAVAEDAFGRGLPVEQSLTARDALRDLFATRRPELVVLDLRLPDMDGLTLFRHMRTQTHLRDVPVIMLSASSDWHTTQVALDAGIDSYIYKPFDYPSLVNAFREMARLLQQRRQPPIPVRAAGARRPKNVVIVEDDIDTAAVLRALVGHPDVAAEIAGNGVEGIARVRVLQPQLVLLDVQLPGMDGFEVFRVLRRELDLGATRIVFITGHAEAGALALAKELGAYATFRKPFDPESLQKRLFQALDVKRETGRTPSARTETGTFLDLGALDEGRP